MSGIWRIANEQLLIEDLIIIAIVKHWPAVRTIDISIAIVWISMHRTILEVLTE